MLLEARPIGGDVTPDSQEGRERITRLEGRVEDIRDDVARNERTFGPLPLAVERLQWTIDAINTRLDKRDKEDADRFEQLARSFENQVIACRGAVEGVSKEQKRQSEVFLAWQKEERDRRDAERKEAQQTKVQEWTTRYGARVAIAAVLISALTSIGLTIFGGQ